MERKRSERAFWVGGGLLDHGWTKRKVVALVRSNHGSRGLVWVEFNGTFESITLMG